MISTKLGKTEMAFYGKDLVYFTYETGKDLILMLDSPSQPGYSKVAIQNVDCGQVKNLDATYSSILRSYVSIQHPDGVSSGYIGVNATKISLLRCCDTYIVIVVGNDELIARRKDEADSKFLFERLKDTINVNRSA